MFGMAATPGDNPGKNAHQGTQVRGFGFTNDANADILFRSFQARIFNSSTGERVGLAGGDAQRRDVEAFMLIFDNDLAPIVGQQITLDASNATTVGPRIHLLRARGCALRAKGTGWHSDCMQSGCARCSCQPRNQGSR